MNKVILIGRLTREPELRYSQSGDTAIVHFGLAVNRKYKQDGGPLGPDPVPTDNKTHPIDAGTVSRPPWRKKFMMTLVVRRGQSVTVPEGADVYVGHLSHPQTY